jgi:hypothetical protein
MHDNVRYIYITKMLIDGKVLKYCCSQRHHWVISGLTITTIVIIRTDHRII